ncbi:hypothetical protein DIZ76_017175 [Coccidioides immitis]|nr:hypothetical protein DIZ76_017175 [Coccidioides immitis]
MVRKGALENGNFTEAMMLREEGRAIGMAEKDREGQDLKTTQAKVSGANKSDSPRPSQLRRTVPRGRPENPLELAKDATSSRGRAKSPMEQIPQMPKDISRYRTRYLRVVVLEFFAFEPSLTGKLIKRALLRATSHIGGEPRGR